MKIPIPLQSVKSLLNIVFVCNVTEDLDNIIDMKIITLTTEPSKIPINNDSLGLMYPYSASFRSFYLFFYLFYLLIRK